MVFLLTAFACTEPSSDSLLDSSWVLVWEDDFEGSAGDPPDPDRWQHDVGGDGWGNAQLEHNTDRTDNARLSGDGVLEIVARREDFEGNAYTSARLKTQDRFTQGYGRYEADIKLPSGQGLWPAFWMLGDGIDDVGWPLCGEVDIMEFRGEEPSHIQGTVHGPGYSGGDGIGAEYTLQSGTFSDDFHTFSVEIDPGHIAWYIDDVRYHVVTRASLPPSSGWVFDDNDFFLLLNLAVGGNYVENPTEDTPFPATMSISHVRVYERAGGSPE